VPARVTVVELLDDVVAAGYERLLEPGNDQVKVLVRP